MKASGSSKEQVKAVARADLALAKAEAAAKPRIFHVALDNVTVLSTSDAAAAMALFRLHNAQGRDVKIIC